MRLIIDTDTAGDDAFSILLALKAPHVTLEAITICNGNVPFLQQAENALLACKGLVEVCWQGRHGDDRAEAAEHGGHAQHHAPHAEAAAVNEKDSYSQHCQHRQ